MNCSDPTPTCCQVCTDPAAAFYCGAQVCEACKKFFIRSWKHSKENNYVCLHDMKCVLTKESRKHCACCRYERCLQLKMYLPGGPRVSQEISRIPCRICGAPSTGFHFGTITCDGCKGFFRRCCHDNKFDKFKCNENNSCIISAINRSMCKACRLKKCLDAGMVAEKCRIGRQPNIIIHKTKLELQKILNEQSLINYGNETILPISKKFEIFSEECKYTPSISDNNNLLPPIQSNFIKTENDSHSIKTDPGTNIIQMKIDVNKMNDPSCYRTQHHTSENLWTFSDKIKCNSSHCFSKSKSLHSKRQISPSSYVEPNNCSELFPWNASCNFPLNFQKPEDNLNANHSDVDTPLPVIQSPIPLNSNECTLPTAALSAPDPATFQTEIPIENHMKSGSETSSQNESDDITNKTEEAVVMKTEQNTNEMDLKSSKTFLDKVFTGWNMNDIVEIISNAFNSLTPVITKYDEQVVNASMSHLEMWNCTMKRFEYNARASLNFARKVPGFKLFPLSSQIELIQKSMYPIILSPLSLLYDPVNKVINFFMWNDVEKEMVLTNFKFFAELIRTFISLGEVIKTLQINKVELSFLLSIFVLNASGNFEYKEMLIDALKYYVKTTHGGDTQRHNHILMAMRSLMFANQIHKEMLINLTKHCDMAKLPIPQLFEETFLNANLSELV